MLTLQEPARALWFKAGCGEVLDGATLTGLIRAPAARTVEVLDLRGNTATSTASLLAMRHLKRLRVLDLSSCGASVHDDSLHSLAAGLATHGTLRKLAIGSARRNALRGPSPCQLHRAVSCEIPPRRNNPGNNRAVTDDGLRWLGEALGDCLEDLCLFGCHRITDIGIMYIATAKLSRVNFCGCYKVTDAGRRRLIDQNSSILTYNRPREFAQHVLPALWRRPAAGNSDNCSV